MKKRPRKPRPPLDDGPTQVTRPPLPPLDEEKTEVTRRRPRPPLVEEKTEVTRGPPKPLQEERTHIVRRPPRPLPPLRERPKEPTRRRRRPPVEPEEEEEPEVTIRTRAVPPAVRARIEAVEGRGREKPPETAREIEARELARVARLNAEVASNPVPARLARLLTQELDRDPATINYYVAEPIVEKLEKTIPELPRSIQTLVGEKVPERNLPELEGLMAVVYFRLASKFPDGYTLKGPAFLRSAVEYIYTLPDAERRQALSKLATLFREHGLERVFEKYL